MKNMSTNPYIHIGSWHDVVPKELIMLQAEINYTTLYFMNGEKAIIATTLKHLETKLKPYNFFRTHRSYIINMDCIKHFRECDCSVQMADNQFVDVSRRKLVEFKRKLFLSKMV